MADLSTNFVGIRSPNPFWLASAPPTDKSYNVNRAFEAGWGGVVWKTLGMDPPVVNVSSRYGAVQWNGQRIGGFVKVPVNLAPGFESGTLSFSAGYQFSDDARQSADGAYGTIQIKFLR